MSHPDRKKVRALVKVKKRANAMAKDRELDCISAKKLEAIAKESGCDPQKVFNVIHDAIDDNRENKGGWKPEKCFKDQNIKIYRGGGCSPR
jgi:cytochrome oxidase assembly protein ShyY1